jgi:hypothetical protein
VRGSDLLKAIWHPDEVKYITQTLHGQNNRPIRYLTLHSRLYRLLAAHRPAPKLKTAKGRHTDATLEDWYREQKSLSELYEKDLAFHPERADSWYMQRLLLIFNDIAIYCRFQLGVCWRQLLTLKLDEVV